MTEQDTGTEETVMVTDMTEPIIIDLGKQKRKRLKQLKKGKGKLWYEVLDVLEEVDVQLGDEVSDRVLVPVVLIYQRKLGRRNRMFPFG
jgi:hypothetical protein